MDISLNVYHIRDERYAEQKALSSGFGLEAWRQFIFHSHQLLSFWRKGTRETNYILQWRYHVIHKKKTVFKNVESVLNFW
jgi:hypothetical protein